MAGEDIDNLAMPDYNLSHPNYDILQIKAFQRIDDLY